MKSGSIIAAAILGLLFSLTPLVHAMDEQKMYALLEAGEVGLVTDEISKMPAGAEELFWESKIKFYQGDYRGAIRDMNTALSKPNAQPYWKNLRNYYVNLLGATTDFTEVQSQHFILYARGFDLVLTSGAISTLESAYAVMGRELGVSPTDKVRVEIWTTKPQFALATTIEDDVLEKSGTVGLRKFNRIMMLSPEATPLGFRWQDTLAHEYVHYCINRLSMGNCPLWLHEGTARFLETAWRLQSPNYLTPYSINVLAKATVSKNLIPFSRMSPSLIYLKDQDEIALAFAEVSEAVAFLRETFGGPALKELIGELAVSGENDSFKTVLGMTAKKFSQLYVDHLEKADFPETAGAFNELSTIKTGSSENDFIGADLKEQIKIADEMRLTRRYAPAVEEYVKALKKQPNNPVLCVKLAKAFVGLKREKDAIATLRDAIEANPNYVTPYQVLGELYFNRGKFPEAVDTLQEAIAINPFHRQSAYLLARSYLETKHYDKALIQARNCLVLNPFDLESRMIFERLSK